MTLLELFLIWFVASIIILCMFFVAEGLDYLAGDIMLESTKVLLAVVCLFPITFPVGFVVGLCVVISEWFNNER